MAATIQPLVKAQPNLGLPFAPEIRNEIYKHALSDPARREGGGPDASPRRLLLASRQTNIEAYAMYYRNNKLHFPNLTLLARTSPTSPSHTTCMTRHQGAWASFSRRVPAGGTLR